MSKELTSQEKKVIEQYSGFPEGKRLSYTKAHETEFSKEPRQVFFRILSGISCSRDSARHRSISS